MEIPQKSHIYEFMKRFVPPCGCNRVCLLESALYMYSLLHTMLLHVATCSYILTLTLLSSDSRYLYRNISCNLLDTSIYILKLRFRPGSSIADILNTVGPSSIEWTGDPWKFSTRSALSTLLYLYSDFYTGLMYC